MATGAEGTSIFSEAQDFNTHGGLFNSDARDLHVHGDGTQQQPPFADTPTGNTSEERANVAPGLLLQLYGTNLALIVEQAALALGPDPSFACLRYPGFACLRYPDFFEHDPWKRMSLMLWRGNTLLW